MLIQVTFGSSDSGRRFTYEAPDTVKVNDTVEITRPNGNVGTAIVRELGSDYTGPVKSVTRVL